MNRWFPSSKQCAECGWKHTDLKLSEREWMCQQCGVHHDRDINAARNLQKEEITQLQSSHIAITSTVGTTGSHAWGDHVSHVTTNAVVEEPRIPRL